MSCDECPTPKKKSYPDEEAASKALARTFFHPSQGRKVPLRVYWCEEGQHYHLTSRLRKSG